MKYFAFIQKFLWPAVKERFGAKEVQAKEGFGAKQARRDCEPCERSSLN